MEIRLLIAGALIALLAAAGALLVWRLAAGHLSRPGRARSMRERWLGLKPAKAPGDPPVAPGP